MHKAEKKQWREWVGAAENRAGEILKLLACLLFVLYAAGLAVAADIKFAAQVTYPVNDYASQIAVGDFTRDGNLDLVVVTSQGGGFAILPGSPTGGFGAPQWTSPNYYVPSVITAGDLNNDGLPDLVMAGSHNINGGTPFGLQSFMGQPDGTLTGLPYSILSYGVKVMSLRKLNNNRFADLVMTVAGPTGVAVFPGAGDGTFGAEQFTSLPNSKPVGFAAGDFNNDGKLDLAVSDQGNRRILLLLGNGDGTFQMPLSIALSEKTSAVAAGDLNGDGKTDLVVAGTGHIFSLLGNGDGTFQAAQEITIADATVSLIVRDLNCDGIPDVATANFNGPGVALLQGKGDGTFEPPQYLEAGSEPRWIVSGDFNHDGRPDLAVANYGSENVSVYLNTTKDRGSGCGK